MDTLTSNSVTYKIINRSESEDARKIDATCKNKWKWSWLEEKDENGDYLSSYVRKINVSGSAFCIYCNKPLVYGNTGKKDLSMLRNQQNTCLVRRNIYPPHSYHFIGGSLQSIHQVRLVPVPLARECIMPYGVAENVHTTAAFQIVNIILKVIFYLLLQKTHYRYQSSLN